MKGKRGTVKERRKRAQERLKRRRERAYERRRAQLGEAPAARDRMRAYLRAHFPHMSRARREAFAVLFDGAAGERLADVPLAAEVEDGD